MNRIARRLPVVLIPMLLGLSSPTIQAGQMLADQQNQVTLDASWSAMHLAPIGQEFVPKANSLDFVELYLANTDPSSPNAADVVINVRQGDILGPIVGTSMPFGILFNSQGVARFDFSSPVLMVPGNQYVIEVVIAAGTGNVAVAGGWIPGYAQGRLIVEGVPVPSTDNSDLWFREGSRRGGGKRSAR